ncbi:hypothetical protein C5167_006707, partial [Papaver somniferum]
MYLVLDDYLGFPEILFLVLHMEVCWHFWHKLVEKIFKRNDNKTVAKKGEKYERHCPDSDHQLNCLVPAPVDYKTSIPWPKSRDEVWFVSVPHTRLVEDKGGQNWITRVKHKFVFPGGDTQFIPTECFKFS